MDDRFLVASRLVLRTGINLHTVRVAPFTSFGETRPILADSPSHALFPRLPSGNGFFDLVEFSVISTGEFLRVTSTLGSITVMMTVMATQ